MPSLQQTKILPYSPEQLFTLVADVARYPEFLPWCKAARIIERDENSFLAELVIRFAHMSESYVSRVTLTPHTQIDVVMQQGPFEYLTNEWRFTPQANGHTQIDFALDFKFRSRMLESVMGGLFGKANDKMIAAFSARAQALYGIT